MGTVAVRWGILGVHFVEGFSTLEWDSIRRANGAPTDAGAGFSVQVFICPDNLPFRRYNSLKQMLKEEVIAKMHRRCGNFFASFAVFAILLSGQAPARAEDNHPVFIAPDFQFDQVDALCVMPLIDARNGAQPVNLDDLRPVLMLRMQDKGYRVLDPGCSHDSGASAPQSAKSRWILTVRLDSFEVSKAAPGFGLGSYLTASLFDTQAGKEVWRDTAKTGYGGRFASSLLGSTPDSLVESGFGAVLAKFEKQKKPYPPSQATMWPPMSFSARLYRYHSFTECNGRLTFDSGTLSFEPSSNGKGDNKCASLRFSAQGAKFGAAMWLIVPGKSKYYLQQPGGTQILYLDLALRAAR